MTSREQRLITKEHIATPTNLMNKYLDNPIYLDYCTILLHMQILTTSCLLRASSVTFSSKHCQWGIFIIVKPFKFSV